MFQFKRITSESQIPEKLSSPILLIFLDPQNLKPSQKLLHYLHSNPISLSFASNILVSQTVSTQLYTLYNVTHFPTICLLGNAFDNILYYYVGNTEQRIQQCLGILCQKLGFNKPEKRLKAQFKYCPSQHQLQLISNIDENLYKRSCFNCDICKNSSHITKNKPILHCNQCYYDICNMCAFEEIITKKMEQSSRAVKINFKH